MEVRSLTQKGTCRTKAYICTIRMSDPHDRQILEFIRRRVREANRELREAGDDRFLNSVDLMHRLGRDNLAASFYRSRDNYRRILKEHAAHTDVYVRHVYNPKASARHLSRPNLPMEAYYEKVLDSLSELARSVNRS